MDDQGWSWPAWKFGMKREDLFSKLHDQYNTFPSTIQDPEAFHYDVVDISNTACNADEFHHLLAERKEKRLQELNHTLASASVEIIANPDLIGTHQWQYALQLFRTKSLDSLVRYFASYLPEDHPWHFSSEASCEDDATTHHGSQSSVSSLDVSTDSDSVASSHQPFFDDQDDRFMTHEPLIISTSIPSKCLPLSPRSMTICSSSSSTSSEEPCRHSRTSSCSEDDPDVIARCHCLSLPDEERYLPRWDEPDTPPTPASEYSETTSCCDFHTEGLTTDSTTTPAAREDSVVDSIESDTPTPRNEKSAGPCIFAVSSYTSEPSQQSCSPLYNQVLQEYIRSSRRNARDGYSCTGRISRKTSPEVGRVQKSQLDPLTRARPRARERKR